VIETVEDEVKPEVINDDMSDIIMGADDVDIEEEPEDRL